MKYLSYEGLQYLYSKILTRLGLKVDATGGDISETVIKSLDTVEDKYPVPAAGESVKRFFGKVLTFLRNIKPLTSALTLYVSASIGSDLIGDGSQFNPFKTIQHAIDMIPKDLGDNEVIINVADGLYDEDVLIRNFHGGVIRIYSSNITSISNVCSVKSFFVSNCFANIFISGFNITTTTKLGGIDAYNAHEIIVNYCKTTGTLAGTAGFRFAECNFQVHNCIAINENVALYAYKSYGFSSTWGTTSGNNVGIQAEHGSIIILTGTQPQGTAPRYQTTGGIFLFENGTQITGLISSGLSCTWGNLTGGYYRVGNLNGVAQIVVEITVQLTATLNAGTLYTISGFPIVAAGAGVAVTAHSPSHFGTITLGYDTITLNPALTLNSGNVYLLSCTYITNS